MKIKEYSLKINTNGITLIALVITIIILLILAGVTISGFSGKNGIIEKTDIAKKQVQKKETLEKLQILVYESINKEGRYNAINVGKLLRKNGVTATTDEISNTITGEYNGFKYTVDNYGNVSIDGTIGEEQTTVVASNLREGDHVYYNAKGKEEPVECIVLWDKNSEYGRNGVQIITEDILETITIGSNDKQVAAESYNNAINILNTRARAYLNEEISTQARSVGSIPNSPDSEGEIDSTIGLRKSDNNYVADYEQMRKLQILSTQNENEDNNQSYWFASRNDGEQWDMNDVYLGLYFAYPNEQGTVLRDIYESSNRRYYIVNYSRRFNNFMESYFFSRGLRAVFTLKDNTEILLKSRSE